MSTSSVSDKSASDDGDSTSANIDAILADIYRGTPPPVIWVDETPDTQGHEHDNSLDTFHLFSRLPLEVRHKIWSLAASGGRKHRMELSCRNVGRTFVGDYPEPLVLRAAEDPRWVFDRSPFEFRLNLRLVCRDAREAIAVNFPVSITIPVGDVYSRRPVKMRILISPEYDRFGVLLLWITFRQLVEYRYKREAGKEIGDAWKENSVALRTSFGPLRLEIKKPTRFTDEDNTLHTCVDMNFVVSQGKGDKVRKSTAGRYILSWFPDVEGRPWGWR